MTARDDYPELKNEAVLGVLPSLRAQCDSALDEIDMLRAHVAELESIPPHPAWTPFIILEPMRSIMVQRADGSWVHIGPEPPALP